MSDNVKNVEALIGKAAEAAYSVDAMRFSQAACNAANAIAVLDNLKSRVASNK